LHAWIALLLLTGSSLARAQTGEGSARDGLTDANQTLPDTSDDQPSGWRFGADMVAGFGRVDAVDLGPAQSLRTVSYVRASTPVSLVSAALSASFPLGEALRAGVRFPLVIGNLAPPADERRSATNLGNLEVGLQWRRPLSKNIDLRAALLLTLPTASGRELPNQSALDAAGPMPTRSPLITNPFPARRSTRAVQKTMRCSSPADSASRHGSASTFTRAAFTSNRS